ncbi:MAG: MAPEG family protein [Burkholderiaceae bacterium]
MPLAAWCILIAGVLPIATVAVAKWGSRDYDNAAPRAWLDKQSGLRRRADYAHRNHFEAFPFFAAAVLLAQQLHAPQSRIDALAALFIVARLVYTWCYLGNRPSLRSLAWLVGYAAVIALFVVAASAG